MIHGTRPGCQQKLAARSQGARHVGEVALLVGEVFGRLYRPYQIERRGRELEVVGVRHFKVHLAFNPCLAERSRAYIQNMNTSGMPEEVGTVVEHPELRIHRGFIVQKQPVMEMVAPERAIKEGQRVVMISNLIGRDGHGSHEF